MDLNAIIEKLLEDMNLLEEKTKESKKILILHAAEDMEREGFEPSKICAKLTEILVPDKASDSLVRKALPKKYKQEGKIRESPIKQLVNGKQEAEKEVVNLKEQKDVKIGHNEESSQDTTNNFEKTEDSISQNTSNNETKQETPPNPTEEQSIIEKQDKQIRDLVSKIIELKKQLKEKDIEIHTLKGQLAMQPTISPYKDINRMTRRLK